MKRGGLIAIGAVLAPIAFVVGIALPRSERGVGLPSQDFYGYRAPLIDTLRRALEQGSGLLWNDLQSAGQPFLTMPSSGIFYLPTLLIVPFETTPGAMVWLVFHLALAGVGAALFARQLGLRAPAVAATMLAVQFGGLLTFFAFWAPLVLATVAWLPLILFAAERLFRSPSAGAAIALGVLLTVQLVAGFPQTMVFSYLLLGLRVLWEFATAGFRNGRALVLGTGAALILPLFLGAFYLVPALEVAALSVRALPMASSVANVAHAGDAWERFAGRVAGRSAMGGFVPVVVFFAGAALGRAGSRRVVAGYLSIALLFLALIPESWLRDFYQSLPLLSNLRGPTRFAWVASLCMGLLSGVGVEALAAPRDRKGLAIAIGGALFAGFVFHWLVPKGLTAGEAGLGLALVAAAVAGWVLPRMRRLVALLLLLGLIAGMRPVVLQPGLRLYAGNEETHAARPVFERVAAKLTAQDRVLVWPQDRWGQGSIAVLDKSPALYGLPSISDYEHLVTERYASLYRYLGQGRFLSSAVAAPLSFSTPLQRMTLPNLLAARFIVTDRRRPDFPGRLIHLASFGKFHAFENPAALPRAYVVPRAQVIEEPRERLEQLGRHNHDPRRRVLLSRPPRDGELGAPLPPGTNAGRVRFVRAYGESLAVAVSAPRGGFLVLTDQYFPGWRAAVDGQPAELLIANHAFRAVRVPPGRSRVTFDYEPASLFWGGGISAASLLLLLGAGVRVARRRRAAA